MENDDLEAATARINAGAEVATVEPSLIEYMWKLMSSIPREQRQSTSPGFTGVLADPGRFPQNPDEHVAMMIRYALLSALVEGGIVDDYMKDESLRQKVFTAAALFPCDGNALAEAVAQRDSSPGVTRKTGGEFRRTGYDPEQPKVSKKFIEWMLHNC